MVLARVIYELFETETGTADVADRGEPVYLDRQLRLELADAGPVFIAWTWGALPASEYRQPGQGKGGGAEEFSGCN
jgi:hypothetical protein